MLRRDPLADPAPLIKRVYAYAAYRLGDGADAEDATSETFERAVKYRKSYDPRKGEPVAWLLGIAKRCIDGGWSKAEFPTQDVDSVDTTDLEEETLRRLMISRAVAALGRTPSRWLCTARSAACAESSESIKRSL